MERSRSRCEIVQGRALALSQCHPKIRSRCIFARVLEICESLEAANAAEEKWILHFDSRNPEKGFNSIKGGGHTPHPIKRHYWQDPEFRARHSVKMKALWNDPQYRLKNQASHKLSINTAESRLKRSIASRVALSRPEAKKKISLANKGKILSAEHKNKISQACKLHMTPERKANLSAQNTGKIMSVETRRKLSLIQKQKRSQLGALFS